VGGQGLWDFPAGVWLGTVPPDDFDWRDAESLRFWIVGHPGGLGSRADIAEIVNGSAKYPDDTYWFQDVGWLDPAQVAEQDDLPGHLHAGPEDVNMTTGRSWAAVTVRVVAGVVTAAAGLLWGWCAVIVVSSRLSTDPAHDPHGYGLIFGSMLALVSELIAAIVVPFAFPSRRRARVMPIAMTTYFICSALLVVAWLTA